VLELYGLGRIYWSVDYTRAFLVFWPMPAEIFHLMDSRLHTPSR